MNSQNFKDHKFHYLKVNRGRFVCSQHGGYCDSCDGYQKECPLCQTGNSGAIYDVNKIDRTLQIVNGLQGRSNRNVVLLGGLVTSIAAIAAFLGGEVKLLSTLTYGFLTVFNVGVIALIMSIAFYILSMPHIQATQTGKFASKTLKDWEKHFLDQLHKIEKWHVRASQSFVFGIAFFAIAVLLQTSCLVDWSSLQLASLCKTPTP